MGRTDIGRNGKRAKLELAKKEQELFPSNTQRQNLITEEMNKAKPSQFYIFFFKILQGNIRRFSFNIRVVFVEE